MESVQHRKPRNNGKLAGQQPRLKPKDIWAIRIQLQNVHQVRSVTMFNLAIGGKLGGYDLVNLRVRDITYGNQILARVMVVQQQTQRLVQFEPRQLGDFVTCTPCAATQLEGGALMLTRTAPGILPLVNLLTPPTSGPTRLTVGVFIAGHVCSHLRTPTYRCNWFAARLAAGVFGLPIGA
jgi:hypothetical protein